MFRARPPSRKQPILKAVKPEDPEWKLLHRVADSKLDKVKRAFLLAIAATQKKVVVARMAEALQAGDLASVENMIDWAAFGAGFGVVKDVFREIVDEVGKVTARRLSEKLKVELRFDLLNPRAVEFINQHTGELITQITEESRQAIRAIVRQAFEEGGHPYEQARKIRNYIGLTERQMRAVDNYWRRLIEEGLRSDKRVNEMADNYAKRLLRRRAETIARTETMKASNYGAFEAHNQALDAGLLPPTAEKEFIVTPDDRLCEICALLDGQRKPLNEPFDTELGPIMVPPVHVNCRCTYGITGLT